MIFGAISKMPVTTTLKNGYDLFNWVTRKNCYPSFWGRSITGDNRIDEDEICYLRKNNCRVMPIFDELKESDVTKVTAHLCAEKAVKALKQLGIPDEGRICVFALIEPDWCVNHNWMLNYARAMTSMGYVPGFIGNTDSSKNFSFDREVGHFLRFARNNNMKDPMICATEPKTVTVDEWKPFCPSDMEQNEIAFWSHGRAECGNVFADTVLARDKYVLANTW